MEEDIKVLEEMLDIDKHLGKFLSDNRRQAIENLINRNKELEELDKTNTIMLNAEIERNKELEEKRKTTMGVIGANYIHKDKVREKIEEMEKKQVLHSRYGEIKVLQELLVEGDK